MHRVRHSGQAFEVIHLVKETTATCHFSEMLGFIHDECTRLTIQQGFFEGSTQIRDGQIPFNDQSALLIAMHITHIVGDFVCDEWLIQSKQRSCVVLLPVTAATVWYDRLH